MWRAGSGRAALKLLETLQVDLLISDQRMPGMTGVELARHLEAERPGIPILLMSGYAQQALGSGGTLEGRPFLPKPFSAGPLL